MERDGLLIGEIAERSGASRKAVRLYEEAGILSPPHRTSSGYRIYSRDTLNLLALVRQAQRLGFTVAEIKEIVSIKRAGRAPCLHARNLVRRKADELDQRLADLKEVRELALTLRWGDLPTYREHQGRRGKRRGSETPNHEGGRDMENLKMSLCPMCDHCPEVEIVGDEVRIGEAGNLAVLKKGEWNVLVDLIASGQLTKV
jgi:DNA-binding transcriptional MerR regulator